jgi:hypothetical protein
MVRKRTSRIVTYAGIGVIAAVIVFMIFLQLQTARDNDFKSSIDKIAGDTVTLTGQYQAEVGKWMHKQYSNQTMITIVNNYLPRYQQLIDRANALNTPDKYKEVRTYLVKAIETEKESNEHFRNYLATGNKTEDDLSTSLLTESVAQSGYYDAAIRAAG